MQHTLCYSKHHTVGWKGRSRKLFYWNWGDPLSPQW